MAYHITLEARAGEPIGDYIERAIRTAEAAECAVDCNHNERKFTVMETHREQVFHLLEQLYPYRGE